MQPRVKQTEGSGSLNDITIYNMVMIRKTAEDRFEFLYQEDRIRGTVLPKEHWPDRLSGRSGGPIGMVVRMLTGVMAGSAEEDDSEEMSREFLDNVNKQLGIGSVASTGCGKRRANLWSTAICHFLMVIVRRDIADQLPNTTSEQWTELQEELDAKKGGERGWGKDKGCGSKQNRPIKNRKGRRTRR